jgi:hypothetical protein
MADATMSLDGKRVGFGIAALVSELALMDLFADHLKTNVCR